MKSKDSISIFFFKIWMCLAIVVLVVGIVRGDGAGENYLALRKSRDRLLEAVEKLKQETENLEHEIIKIKTSKDYAKKIFKDRYHSTEEGETIVFFAD